MNKLKKGLFLKALPYIAIGVAIMLLIAIVGAIMAEITAAIASDAGYHNKKHEEELEVNATMLTPFTITGRKEGDNYKLNFSFDGYKIENIVVPINGGSKDIKVKVPAITGDREAMAYKYFISRGFTPEGACGLMANIQHESGFKPTIVEYGSGIGYGICQWSFGRRTQIEEWLKGRGLDPYKDSNELYLAQLEYAITENPSYYGWIVDRIRVATSASYAAEQWVRHWEIPANMEYNVSLRSASAENFLKKYKNLRSL